MKGLLVALLLVLAATGCDDRTERLAGTPQFQIRSLVGEFRAESAVFTSELDPPRSFDLLAASGDLFFSVSPDGRYVWRVRIPGRDPLISLGRISISDGSLVLTDDQTGASQQMPFSLRHNTLTLTQGSTIFAFDDPFALEQARIDAVLIR